MLPTESQVGSCPHAWGQQPGWNLGLFLEVGSRRETWPHQECFGPFCAQVNIPEKERDSIQRSSSKGPLTRAIYHSAKVTLFPILMYFWRRYPSIPPSQGGGGSGGATSSPLSLCHAGSADETLPRSSAGVVSLELCCLRRFSRRFCIWKVMRSFRVYQELWSSEIPEEDRSFQPIEGDKTSRVQKEDRSSQEPKRGRSSRVQKEERSSQEAKRGRSSRVQKEDRRSQEPMEDKISRGLKEGKVPASSPAKTPSKAPKVPSPRKLVAITSATRYAPGLFFQCRNILT